MGQPDGNVPMEWKNSPTGYAREELSLEELAVRSMCSKMAGDLISLGKFLRDHDIQNPLEHDLRKAAKVAAAKKVYTIHRYLLAAEARQNESSGKAESSAVQVSEAEAKNEPIDKQIFVES